MINNTNFTRLRKDCVVNLCPYVPVNDSDEHSCYPTVTRTPSIPGIPCSGTNVRTVRIEDDPIHTICCMISAVLICKLITLLPFSIAL